MTWLITEPISAEDRDTPHELLPKPSNPPTPNSGTPHIIPAEEDAPCHSSTDASRPAIA